MVLVRQVRIGGPGRVEIPDRERPLPDREIDNLTRRGAVLDEDNFKVLVRLRVVTAESPQRQIGPGSGSWQDNRYHGEGIFWWGGEFEPGPEINPRSVFDSSEFEKFSRNFPLFRYN